MLGHLRSGTLDKFKDSFDKALSSGEGFSSAARHCSELHMAQFDEKCAGVVEALRFCPYKEILLIA